MTTKQTEEQSGTVTKDPELVALTRVEKALAGIPPAGRQRVLRWILSKPEYAALGGGDCRAAGFTPKAEPAVQA